MKHKKCGGKFELDRVSHARIFRKYVCNKCGLTKYKYRKFKKEK